MAAQDEAERKRRQTQTAIKLAVYLSLACALVFGWDYFPEAFTDKVEALWASATKAISGK
jgi:TRAP-type C4-dicarboxylate transport system permease small subunit